MQETFAKEGLQYNMEGMTGNTLDSHRLIAFAGKEGPEKQNALVEALFKAYFTEARLSHEWGPRSIALAEVAWMHPFDIANKAEEIVNAMFGTFHSGS